MAGAAATAKPGLLVNPVIRKLSKAERTAGSTATYSGIIGKTVYFIIMTLVGVGIFLALKAYCEATGQPVVASPSVEGAFLFEVTMIEALAILAAAVLTLVCALLSAFVRAIVPVTGTIYVLAEGYLLAFITFSLVPEYRWVGALALVLTIVLVLSMLILYRSGAVKVSGKFRVIVGTLFMTIFFGGLIMFLCSLIPGLRTISEVVSNFMANPIVGIIASVVFVIIACLFLISDFDMVYQTVENGLPKKYEWTCAYGIAYTVLYLYLKILQLIIKILGSKGSSK